MRAAQLLAMQAECCYRAAAEVEAQLSSSATLPSPITQVILKIWQLELTVKPTGSPQVCVVECKCPPPPPRPQLWSVLWWPSSGALRYGGQAADHY